MKIYVGHSTNMNFIDELYIPIRELEKEKGNSFILPHEKDLTSSNTREFYSTIDLFIAEVSFPSTGLGIELGWAYDSGIPIYCIYKKSCKYSNSLRSVTDKFLEYETIDDLKKVIIFIVSQVN